MRGPKDITGQRFGRLVIVRLMDERKNGYAMWECKCDCGNIVQVQSTSLQNGTTKSCGCLRKESNKETGKRNIKDIRGQRFGRLVAIRLVDEYKTVRAVWECKCDCGNVVQVKSASLQKGKTKSCGCLKKESSKEIGKRKIKDITGQRFGRLVANRLLDERKNGCTVWECKCDCGNVAQVQANSLSGGRTNSCGCLFQDKLVEYGKKRDMHKQFGLIEDTSVSNIKSKKVSKNSTTGYRGVGYHKKSCKYIAYIGFKKKNYNLGYFATLGEAIEARKQAEEMLFEPFIKWYEENYKKLETQIEVNNEH